jgi:hypothetical protein
MINFQSLWSKLFPPIISTDLSRLDGGRRRWATTTPARVWTFLFCLIAAALVAGRPLGMDKDYQNYLEYYNSILNGEFVNVEIGYKVISWLSYGLGAGFYGVLFAFALTAIYGKCVLMRRLPDTRRREWLYFGVLYFLIFFPLWELTQIRNAAAVSICCLALLEEKKTKALLYFIAAIFLHNVSFMIVCLWLVRRFFDRFKYQIIISVVVSVYGLLEYMPYYQSYAADVYVEKFNPFSLKVLFILISIGYVQVSKGQYAKIFSYYAFGLLLFYFAMGKMPAAAVRVADISLFFTVLAVSISRNYVGIFYKAATLLALGYMFISISYFGDAKLIDLSVFSFKG